MSETPESAASPRDGVLARIVAAHRRGAERARDRTPDLSRAWERSLRHAAVPFAGLDLVPGEVTVAEGASLAQALDALPGNGLVAVLEARGGERGLVALSHGAVDALIEVQTTGAVEARELPPRPVTRIDEALSRDFIDLALAAFARETDGIGDRDWPDRMSYGSGIADRRQLTLLLPDRPYHLLAAELRLGAAGRRQARALIALPRTVRGAGQRDAGADQPEAWRTGLNAALQEAELRLEAVLFRARRPLREVERLAPGDVIHFDPADLAQVALETPGGRRVLSGLLGQVSGHRALRIAEGPTDAGQGAEAPDADPGRPAPGGLSLDAPPEPEPATGGPVAPQPVEPGDPGVLPQPVAPGAEPVDAAAVPDFDPPAAPPDFAPSPSPLPVEAGPPSD